MPRHPVCPQCGHPLGVLRSIFAYWEIGLLPKRHQLDDYCRRCFGVWVVSYRTRSVVASMAVLLMVAVGVFAYDGGDGLPLFVLAPIGVLILSALLIWSARFIDIRVNFPLSSTNETPRTSA